MICIVVGYVSPIYRDQTLSVGVFAFSGAITNWLAVYMLFEKVPGLYGSGVIPNQFDEFRLGIKSLMMNQFFTKGNINKFFEKNTSSSPENDGMNFDKVLDSIDYEKVFQGLIEVVMASPMGGMLVMMGGAEALNPLKDPFVEKMRIILLDITKSDEFKEGVKGALGGSDLGEAVSSKVEEIVDMRLAELTPQLVKEIIQEMIRKHLGWLVVWGGVFGGLIGLGMSFVS